MSCVCLCVWEREKERQQKKKETIRVRFFVCKKKWAISIGKTRMTTFIKTKFKKSDDQTNIDKYIVVANITEHHIL